jgi:hypothetical protein
MPRTKSNKNISRNKKNNKFQISVLDNFYIKIILVLIMIVMAIRIAFNEAFESIGLLNETIKTIDFDPQEFNEKIYREIKRASVTPLDNDLVEELGEYILIIYKDNIEQIFKPLNSYLDSKK